MKLRVYDGESLLTTQGLDDLLTIGEVKELERIARRIGQRLQREELFSSVGLSGFRNRRRR